ncbi:GGDEF domain-containing protein [Paenibacillus sp. GSMTC-2017]|uniref:GGDEF domain-containing protein n=1 Tax=Paenibacillus sp. GSMTC-2017 TaxID=2794350 RepID=UPI0018D92669|nr:GGDEF domain-containing protein [Paenibacillus sp. GSMTC-2017]MBH5317007.1 GGDEF domain-containing protein [Paenibacillus sp. GSMTC-2017]
MTIMQWITGPNGQLFSSSSVIVILILMLFMSIKLYVSYRNKQTYRLLIAAISLIIARQCLLVALAFPGWTLEPWMYLVSNILQIISFIIINFVFMKLYTYRSAQLRIVPFIFMLLLTIVLSFIQIALTPLSTIPATTYVISFPLLDIYCIVVSLIILLATRSADMNTKYYSSLIVFIADEIVRMADAYLFQGSQPWLLLFNLVSPIIYFSLLFVLLFEWVIERLMSTYQSSIVDGLTGLYNRRHFNSKAEQLLLRSKSVAIIFCDIDNFKRLNDTQGHHVADGVLKRVSEIIKEETSGIGSAGRYGGEELLACISIDRVKPDIVAESIRRRVEAETVVTISIGFSTTKESVFVGEMIRLADEAMYYSKTTGKNRVTAYKAMPASYKTKKEI